MRIGPMRVIACFAMILTSCGNHTEDGEDQVEFDVTDCVDISEGEIWSAAFDGQERRVLAPDTNAIYWMAVIPALHPDKYSGTHFEIRGQFPNSRYFSLHNYNEEGQFIDVKLDQEIAPDPGSVHPFRDDIPYPSDGTEVNYTLKLVDAPVSDQAHSPGDNILFGGYLPVTGEPALENRVMYRVYLPANPEERTGGVPLPRVFYVFDAEQANDGTPTTRAHVCDLIPTEWEFIGFTKDEFIQLEQDANERAPALAENPNRRAPGYHPPDPVRWVIGETTLGLANVAFPVVPDDMIPSGSGEGCFYFNFNTRYIAAFLDPARPVEKLAVVRFKASVTPEQGQPIVPGSYQVRYWSACVYQSLNALYAWGCGHEDQLASDPDAPDRVTIVFSSEEDRPDGLCDPLDPESSPPGCRFNWMPYASAAPLVFMRQLVPDENFSESTLFYNGDPYDSAALQEHMGEYYPESTYCTEQRFLSDQCGL